MDLWADIKFLSMHYNYLQCLILSKGVMSMHNASFLCKVWIIYTQTYVLASVKWLGAHIMERIKLYRLTTHYIMYSVIEEIKIKSWKSFTKISTSLAVKNI